jgi:dUTP pyrophosphatase
MNGGANELLSSAGRAAIAIHRLPGNDDLPLPAYETPGAAGMDIRSAEALTIAPGQRALIGTGLAMAIAPGFEVQVRPRSGLAAKHGITVLNTPGTIDSDYRGEIKVILINLGDRDFAIARGERIAQLVIAPVVQAVLTEVAELGETLRGSGGFGSTGSA